MMSIAITSMPGIAVPTESRRVASLSAKRVMVTTAPVSVSPYATSTSHQRRTLRTSASATELPAMRPVRSERSVDGSNASSRMRR